MMIQLVGQHYANKQWVINSQENMNHAVPLTGYTKVCEMAVHKTPASGITAVSVRDSGNGKYYIVSNNKDASSSYWFGIFI